MHSYHLAIEDTPGPDFPLHYLSRFDYRKRPERSVPTIIYLHGFTGGKESHLEVRIGLADIGYLVVSFDASAHGSRGALPDLWNACRVDFAATFFSVLRETVADTERVYAALRRDPQVDLSRMGLIGGSMGAMVCLMAIPGLAGLKAAVSLAGTCGLARWYEETSGHEVYQFPKRPLSSEVLSGLEDYDPIRRPEDYPPVALLMMHGEQDLVVPPRGQKELYERLKPLYESRGVPLELRLYPELGHETSPELIRDMHEWLQANL